MKINSFLAKPFANYVYKGIRKGMATAVEDQEAIFKELLKTVKTTDFGKEHHLQDVLVYEEFVGAVPIRDYEQFKPYIEKIKEGRHNVLWKGRPIYFAKTSGTTSGVKYIPISKDSIGNHINTARNALLCYIAESGNTRFTNGKMIFLSGSPELERIGGIPTGRLSGIVNHHVPSYLRKNQLPSYETNCIEEWEQKLDKIVSETIDQDMTLISGIPPWMQMYFDELVKRTGKKVADIFPNFSVMVQGGVNFGPYKAKLLESIGKKIDTIELFPASEGFFAFQDSQNEEGLLLNTNSGIFFEFVPAGEIFNEKPTRLSMLGLPAQYEHPDTRRLACAGRDRLPWARRCCDGPQHDAIHADGPRGVELDLCSTARRYPSCVREHGRRHVLPFGHPRNPRGRRLQGQHHLQGSVQRCRRHDRRPTG